MEPTKEFAVGMTLTELMEHSSESWKQFAERAVTVEYWKLMNKLTFIVGDDAIQHASGVWRGDLGGQVDDPIEFVVFTDAHILHYKGLFSKDADAKISVVPRSRLSQFVVAEAPDVMKAANVFDKRDDGKASFHLTYDQGLEFNLPLDESTLKAAHDSIKALLPSLKLDLVG